MTAKKKDVGEETTVVGVEVVTAEEALKHLEPTISKEEAEVLDSQINSEIHSSSKLLMDSYFRIAAPLYEICKGKGYAHLGCKTAKDYLDSKKEYGRSYLYHLLKLGEVGESNLKHLNEMTPSKLIEFVKYSDKAEEIPQLIEAKWAEVKDKSVRETRKELAEYVSKHKAPKKKKVGRKKKTYLQRFETEYEKVTDKTDYLKQIMFFVGEQRSDTLKNVLGAEGAELIKLLKAYHESEQQR